MRLTFLRHLVRPQALVVAAIVAGAGLAAVLPADSAVAADSPSLAAVRVESPGQLVARGAGVTVQVTVICLTGNQGGLSASLTQRVGGDIATGFGSVSNLTCTGNSQTFDVVLQADENPFHKGSALASASLFVFNQGQSVSDTRTIDIDR
jgi:hypothetical protein